ncbi:MAG: hypothetical protein J0M07_14040 [Anaerolineae bacterium]|jgi:hypothetical protein|nr:hypothetical protein [Chloroflexota bacterium]MBN8636444.1 hypothetical protein [Anaerolineae bacterium]
MSAVPFGLDELRSCLVSVPPLDLKGMRLLREQPQLLSGTARVPRPQLIEAVTEIVAYTGRCTAATRSLANLTPIPLLAISIGEFGL